MKIVIMALTLALALTAGAPTAAAQEKKTEILDANAKRMLLGTHMLSLQWVSWDRFGKATVVERNGMLFVNGEQKAATGTDFVKIDGRITRVAAREFTFRGTIVTQVSHINGGQPCTREGEFTFAVTGKRRYWRLQQMDNPCDPVTDYVDIYFR